MNKTNYPKTSSAQYGLALKRVLHERDISISAFAQRIDLSSRNTVHRILSGRSNFESVKKMHRKITENQARLHFSDEDMLLLQQALDHCRYGEQGWTIQKTIMDLILNPAQKETASPCVCCVSTDSAWYGKSIDAVVSALVDDAEVDILLLNAVYPPLLAALQGLLAAANRSSLQLRIRHILNSIRNPFAEMQQLVHLQPLTADSRYLGYRKNARPEIAVDTAGAEQTMTICRRSVTGDRTVEWISFLSDRSFAYCSGLSDADGRLAQYYTAYGKCLIESCSCLSPGLAPKQITSNFFAMNAEFAQYEQCWSQILIRPNLCISQIPTEYVMRLIRDSENFGLPPNAPEISEFQRIHRQRYENFISGKHGYVFIFSKAGMRQFMETGRLCDHIPGLPPFTPEERYLIVKNLLQMAEERAGVLLRVFRDDYEYNNTVISLFDDKMLYLFPAGEDKSNGTAICRIADRTYIHPLRTIVRQNLFPQYLCEREETMAWIRDLLHTYDT